MIVMPPSAQERLDRIEQVLQPQRQALLEHDVYQKIRDAASLRTFMQYHVFAVWDFMSLLKALQQKLTCVAVPWLPTENNLGRRLVNEIVLGEESDEDGEGGFCSHYELYQASMRQMGADGYLIDRFITRLGQGRDVTAALYESDLPRSIVQFVTNTFDLIASDNLCAIASGFTYGREDLLPGVFQKIVEQVNSELSGSASKFVFYLERHIELDGDHHGPMAHRLLSHLCGDDDDKWQAAEDAALRSLEARQLLWNGMLEALAY
ncbi:DUF3050 domain-containing protein [Bremerella sp. JC817]|uniref:DUF3050 domain-containing protein n=1 Tax=Bremerella sp. JC817 TaxID=3231756 RepID=UPI003459E4AC